MLCLDTYENHEILPTQHTVRCMHFSMMKLAALLALTLTACHAAVKVYDPVPTISPSVLSAHAAELRYEIAHHRFGFIVGVARSGEHQLDRIST